MKSRRLCSTNIIYTANSAATNTRSQTGHLSYNSVLVILSFPVRACKSWLGNARIRAELCVLTGVSQPKCFYDSMKFLTCWPIPIWYNSELTISEAIALLEILIEVKDWWLGRGGRPPDVLSSSFLPRASSDCMATAPDLSHSSTTWDWNEGANVLWGRAAVLQGCEVIGSWDLVEMQTTWLWWRWIRIKCKSIRHWASLVQGQLTRPFIMKIVFMLSSWNE